MTISADYFPNIDLGNGTTVTFAVNFPFGAPGDLVVNLFDTAALTNLAPAPVLNGAGTYDYIVSGTPNSDTGIYPGGSITFNTAPPASYRVVRERVTARRQNTALTNNGPFPAKAVEGIGDRAEMQLQEDGDLLSRAVIAPAGVLPVSMVIPAAFFEGGQLLAYDPVAEQLTTQDPSVAQAQAAAAAAIAAAGLALGIAYLFVNTLTLFRAISAVTAAATPNAFLRSYAGTLGDGAAGAFFWNASDSRSDDSATIINPTGNAGVGRWNRFITDHISVNWWNPPINQTGDAGPALRSAIAAAAVWKVREIRSFGKLLVASQICNATFGWTLPAGLTFRGVGQEQGLFGTGTVNALWVYSGAANTDMFDIRGPNAGADGTATNNILFTDLQIACDVGNGFMSVNLFYQDGSTYAAPIGGVTPGGAQNIKFKNIKASGHFNRWFFAGRNCFEITIDDDCHIENFLRGVQLSGCDDNYVGGRFEGNASRHIMLEKQGTYGNANRLRPNFLGQNGAGDATELHYAIYDTAERTYMDAIYTEVDGSHCDAILYLDGQATMVMRPFFNGVSGNPAPPIFRLGPLAANCVMICPEATTAASIAHPIIDAQDPSTFLISGAYDNYNIQIINPSTTVTSRINTDSRCCIVGGSIKLLGLNRAPLPQMGLSANGVGLARYQASAQDIGNAAPVAVGMSGIVTDANAGNYNGLAIQLVTTNADGLFWRFVCNRDFTSGDQLKALALVRCTTNPGAGSLALQWRKNGVLQSTPATMNVNTYAVLSKAFDTSSMATGDTVDVFIFNNGMSVAGLIAMMEMINTSH